MKRPAEDDFGYEDDGAFGDEPDVKRSRGKDGDGKGKGRSRKGKGGGGGGGKQGKDGLGPVKRYAFKVLCSDPLAANVIGHGGETRMAIEDATGATVWISKRDQFYPNSHCRILILHGDEPQQVFGAVEKMVERLQEVAEKDRGQDVEVPLIGKEANEYVFRAALPSFIRGKLIGRSGENIKLLREETNAKIFVENEVFSSHQLARIIGPPDIMLTALKRIFDMVTEEVDIPEFPDWATTHLFDAGVGGGREDNRQKGDSKGSARNSGGGSARPRSPSPRDDRRDKGHGRGGGPRDVVADRNFGPPSSDPLQLIETFSADFPVGALEMDHAITCSLPNRHVGAIMGRKGENIRNIERETGTRIEVQESRDTEGGDSDIRVFEITGRLLFVYAAHVMVMQKYHQKEQELQEERRREEAAEARRRGGGAHNSSGNAGSGGGGGGKDAAALQAQLQELQAQLAVLQRKESGGGKGAGGGGGGGAGPRRGPRR